jgi:O-antigen/teichoic acid export membrane protein
MLKFGGLGLTACGICVLLSAPILFTWVLRGKYDHGLAVLPLTLTYCAWFSLLTLAQNYLWCAEKARLATTALLMGLALNIGLNLVLLPRWGLIGAVSATTAGNLAALALVLVFAHRQGMRFDRGSLVCCALPVTLMSGPMPAVAALLGLGLSELRHGWIFDASDRAELAGVVVRYTGRLQRVIACDPSSAATPAGLPSGGARE